MTEQGLVLLVKMLAAMPGAKMDDFESDGCMALYGGILSRFDDNVVFDAVIEYAEEERMRPAPSDIVRVVERQSRREEFRRDFERLLEREPKLRIALEKERAFDAYREAARKAGKPLREFAGLPPELENIIREVGARREMPAILSPDQEEQGKELLKKIRLDDKDE